MLTAAMGSSPFTVATVRSAFPIIFHTIYGFGDLVFAALFLKEFLTASDEDDGMKDASKAKLY
jgi:hypothetical protein